MFSNGFSKKSGLRSTHRQSRGIVASDLRMRDSLFIKILLYPFSLIYGAVVIFRNWLFNIKVLESKSYRASGSKVICVGNITMGGTGKTPVTEYLVRLLKDNYSVCVLSRGYKRKTSGFVLSSGKSLPRDIGDEPYQIKQKFPDITLAVDGNRCRGIEKVLSDVKPRPDVFLLDDAFQHRYVTPDLAILLIDYNRLITDDLLFPAGNLREPAKSKDRAQIVVVTKCPADIKPIEFRIIGKKLKLYPYQSLHFTTTKYDEPKALFEGNGKVVKADSISGYEALLLTGIANPAPFEEYVRKLVKNVEMMNFSDHHNFSKNDYSNIERAFGKLSSEKKIIITTEKDAVRMKNDPNFPESLKNHIYHIPMSVSFLYGGEDFDKQILKLCGKK